MLFFTQYKITFNSAISSHCLDSRCITCQDVCVQQSHAVKRLLPLFEVNRGGFIAMLLLRNTEQR